MRPLYASVANNSPALDSTRNAGLWYDKFCDKWRTGLDKQSTGFEKWRTGWTLKGTDNESLKLAWIETVTRDKLGIPDLLFESVTRLHQLASTRGGLYGVFKTDSRFVTGLGRNHPVENGFAWHPTLGVPYLPGSSIKGLVRAWAERERTANLRAPAPDIEYLFGRANAPRSAGRVIFLDAIPIAPVQLEADVITPHYAGWTPDEPPGDWREPVPVPFLTVASQTAFFFSLLPRGIEHSELEIVFHWLRDALPLAGAGAKTAVGYGRFAHDEQRTRALDDRINSARAARDAADRRARLQGTPEGRWWEAIEGKPEHVVLDLVRKHLENQPLPDPAERRGLARAVAATPYLASWRRGETQDRRRIRDNPAKLKARAKLVDESLVEADPAPEPR